MGPTDVARRDCAVRLKVHEREEIILELKREKAQGELSF